MICISSVALTVFVLFAFCATLSGGVELYRFLIAAGNKQRAELVFFCLLVLAIILVVMYIIILLHSKNRTDELKHILELARSGGTVADSRFEKFGVIGGSIRDVFRSVEEVSAKRAQRIRFLNSAVSSLLSLSSEPLLLLDSAGDVMQASGVYLSKFTDGLNKDTIFGMSIEQLYAEVTIIPLRNEMVQKHGPVTVNAAKYQLHFIPLMSDSGEPDGFLVSVGKTNFFSSAANKVLDGVASSVKEAAEAADAAADAAAESAAAIGEKSSVLFGRFKEMSGKFVRHTKSADPDTSAADVSGKEASATDASGGKQ